MVNYTPISWDSHQHFILGLASRTDWIYYAVWHDLGGIFELIGTQKLNPLNSNFEGESGLNIFPDKQGRGLGRLMKKEFIDYIFDNNLLQQITEKVRRNIIRNCQLNQSLGFRQIGEDEDYYYFAITNPRDG
jgi:RimJ/RimL family protein N-acetyltransferase